MPNIPLFNLTYFCNPAFGMLGQLAIFVDAGTTFIYLCLYMQIVLVSIYVHILYCPKLYSLYQQIYVFFIQYNTTLFWHHFSIFYQMRKIHFHGK